MVKSLVLFLLIASSLHQQIVDLRSNESSPKISLANDLKPEKLTNDSNDSRPVILNKTKYVNLVIGIICTLCSGFLIITFVIMKDCRKTPGDIIFALGLSSLLLSIYQVSFGIYYFQNVDLVKSEQFFCQFMSYISVTGFVGLYVYNFAYCLTLRYAIVNVLKVDKKFKIIIHCVGLFFTLIIPYLLWRYGKVEVNDFGLCNISFNLQSGLVFMITLEFVYLLSSIYTVWFFYSSTPRDQDLNKQKNKVFLRYIFYIVATIFMFVAIELSRIQILVFDGQGNQPFDYLWLLVGNIAISSAPIILVGSRLVDPKIIRILLGNVKSQALVGIREKILKKLGESTSNQFQALQSKIREYQIKALLMGITQYYNHTLLMDQNINLDQELKIKKNDQNKIINQVDQSVSSQETQDIPLVVQSKKQTTYFHLKPFLNKLGLNNKNMNEEYQFQIDMQEQQKTDALNTNQTFMTVLSPVYFQQVRVFKYFKLMKLDKIEMNAGESFDVIKNQFQIEKQAGPDGGKSGEFFFFSHDCKWILKTMSQTELLFFRNMFPQYIRHMYLEKHTFINKIYGIFSIDVNQIRDQNRDSAEDSIIHLMLMRNLAQLPGTFILRTFDLKGSEYSREALKEKKNVIVIFIQLQGEINLQKITLKDKDFEATEGQIRIDNSIVDSGIHNIFIPVTCALYNDVLFLRDMGLMDYSLLVMKIAWGDYLEACRASQESIDIQEYILKASLNEFSIIPQSMQDEKLIHYHISIIDYFQTWNISKKVEKTAKQFLTLNPKLDTSAQNPEKYAQRFYEQVVSKLFKKQ